jgi:hypothetical protein
MRALLLIIGLASLIGTVWAPPAGAQDLGKFIRGAILHREDVRRYEEGAHRNHRPEEEHYWHRYGEGLERQRHDHR